MQQPTENVYLQQQQPRKVKWNLIHDVIVSNYDYHTTPTWRVSYNGQMLVRNGVRYRVIPLYQVATEIVSDLVINALCSAASSAILQ